MSLVRSAIDSGVSPEALLEDHLMAGMDLVSERFGDGTIYIPDVLMASRAVHAGIHTLRPLLTGSAQTHGGRVVIGTVAGDLHDIGKSLVAMMLKAVGFEVLDVGIDISPEEFAMAVERYSPDILGLSSLLTTTMPFIRETLDYLSAAGLRSRVKIMVGGRPVTREFAKRVGADAYAHDARAAARTARRLMSRQGS
jgi:5-methyltetrahydrofolate--homocysteine methyltransferase